MSQSPWSWNNPVKERKPTGRWRPRVQRWTGKMILQVQFENTHYNHLDPDQNTTATTYEWCDATTYDLALLAAKLGTTFFDIVPPVGVPVKS